MRKAKHAQPTGFRWMIRPGAFSMTLTCLSTVIAGLTGRSSNHRPGILDCIEIGCFRFRQSNAEVGQARLRVKPGNDTGRVNPLENALATAKEIEQRHCGRLRIFEWVDPPGVIPRLDPK